MSRGKDQRSRVEDRISQESLKVLDHLFPLSLQSGLFLVLR